MKKFFKVLKKALPLILTIGILLGVVAGIAQLASIKTKTISSVRFSVGTYDTETGKFKKDDKTICTKNAFKCEGLTIETDFDNTSEYQIFWYNIDDLYVGCSGVMKENQSFYAGDVPEYAVFARIVVYPSTLDEDGREKYDFKVKFYEAASIASKLTIKVFKEQDQKGLDLMAIARGYSRISAAKDYAEKTGKGLTIRSLFKVSPSGITTINGVEDVCFLPGYWMNSTKDSMETVGIYENAATDLYMIRTSPDVMRYALKYSGTASGQRAVIYLCGKNGNAWAYNDTEICNIAGNGVFVFDVSEDVEFLMIEVQNYSGDEKNHEPAQVSLYEYIPRTEFCKLLYGN